MKSGVTGVSTRVFSSFNRCAQRAARRWRHCTASSADADCLERRNDGPSTRPVGHSG